MKMMLLRTIFSANVQLTELVNTFITNCSTVWYNKVYSTATKMISLPHLQVFWGVVLGEQEEVSVCVRGVRVRTNGERQREEAVEWKGEGTRETALAAQWEDYPMPGLVAAAAAAWTGGSVHGVRWAAGALLDPSKGFHFSHHKPQKEPRRAPLCSAAINLRADSSRGKWASQPALSLYEGLRALWSGPFPTHSLPAALTDKEKQRGEKRRRIQVLDLSLKR